MAFKKSLKIKILKLNEIVKIKNKNLKFVGVFTFYDILRFDN